MSVCTCSTVIHPRYQAGWFNIMAQSSSVSHCLLLYEYDEAIVMPNSCKSSPEVGDYNTCRRSEAICLLKAGTMATQTWTKLHTYMISVVSEHDPYLKQSQPLCIISAFCEQPALSIRVHSCISQKLPSMLQLELSSHWVCFMLTLHSSSSFSLLLSIMSKQASIHTHAQCSHGSVGLVQAHLN